MVSQIRVNGLWSEILTAAVNLPTYDPAKEGAITALAEAVRTATEAVGGKEGVFTNAWYDKALQSIQTADREAQRFFICQMPKAYRKAYAEIASMKESREMN